MTTYVIVGSGAAGVTAAEAIRKNDSEGEITIISRERYPMFFRPRAPEYVIGEVTAEELMVKKTAFYNEHHIALVLETEAASLDTSTKEVRTAGGDVYSFDKLLLACGLTPRRPIWKGSDLNGVAAMHDLPSADDARRFLPESGNVVVVGGGLLGLDMAQALAQKGLHVTHLVRENLPGFPHFTGRPAEMIQQQLTQQGIDVRANTEVKEFVGDNGTLFGVVTTSGEKLQTAFCFVSIGGLADIDWLRNSEINTDKGIVVDSTLQTNVENIWAAGNAAQVLEAASGKPAIQTNWPNAMIQGRVAGKNMAAHDKNEYLGTSTYMTKVGSLQFHMLGTGGVNVEGAHRVEFTCEHEGHYAKITHQDGVLVGAIVTGFPKEIGKIRKAIESASEISLLRDMDDMNETPLSKLFE